LLAERRSAIGRWCRSSRDLHRLCCFGRSYTGIAGSIKTARTASPGGVGADGPSPLNANCHFEFATSQRPLSLGNPHGATETHRSRGALTRLLGITGPYG